MEWSHKNSIFLTKLCLYLFVAGYFLVLAFCPALVRIFVTYNYSAANRQPGSFIATIYSCGVDVYKRQVTMYCQNVLTPVIINPIFKAAKSSAPKNVPRILPFPPDILVPPIAEAAMASNS